NIATNTTAIGDLDTRLDTAETNITNLQGDMTTAQGNISTNTTNIASNTSAITGLQSAVSGITGGSGNINTTGSATVGSLTTTGDATVNGTLTATDISANGVSLGQAEIKSGTTVTTPGVDGYLEVNGADGSYILLNGEDGGISADYMMAYEIGSLGTLDVLVEDTSQPDGYRSVFEADDSGNITNEGTITSGGLITAKGGITTASTDTSGTTTYANATLGDTTVNGNITNTGTITSEGLITANGGLTVKDGEDLTLGGTAVNAIDDGTSGVVPFATTPTASTTLATVATVKNATSSLSAGLGNLNYSSTNYIKAGDNLTKAVSALDSNLYRLEEDVDEMNKEMKAGFASVAALSALQPNARAFNDTQISMGVGNYRGQTGFALGGFHYVNDNLMMNVGAAYAGDHSATFRGGLTFGW
ncbi:MAG: hypothetical protein E7021_02315, partial [Alphaproteobacteria bacterium]|nr:hypothetical protein [Alphaproteobacteria bacterium]